MLIVSKIFVIVFALYLLHNSQCNSLLRSMDNPQSSSNLGEFVRNIRSLETTGQEKQHLCGNRFADMVRLVCKSNFFSMRKKRSSTVGFDRFRRETTLRKECCEVGCTRESLQKLCNVPKPQPSTTPAAMINPRKTGVPFAILKALLEFFAKSRKLSPIGYESKFPVRTHTASSPETSSLENTADVGNIIAEVDVQNNEKPNQYQRGLLFIPKPNIIRDEDDDDLVFFAR